MVQTLRRLSFTDAFMTNHELKTNLVPQNLFPRTWKLLDNAAD